MFSKLWKRTKEVATMYTGTFVVVMILNQLLFFGFCLNPVCLIAAMPHVLFITVIVGTWINKINGWGNDEVAGKAIKKTAKAVSSTVSETNRFLEELNEEIKGNLDKKQKDLNASTRSTMVNKPFRISYEQESNDTNLIESYAPENEYIDYDDYINNEYIDYDDYINEEPPSWLDETPPWTEDEIPNDNSLWIDEKHDLIGKLKKYGVSSIWHMTHINNVEEILRSGILNNKTAYEIKNPTDISDHGVQRWRESEDPIYGRKLHDYAPTYINIKNPMLYVRRDIQHELCLIEISLNALSQHNFIFTDGNAASRNTHFYNSISDLEKLPWDVLKASYWNDFPDGKRKRCSEVLIYPKIAPEHIVKLHCCSSEAWQYLSQFNVPVEITEKLFFGKCSSDLTSVFSSFDDDILF